MNTTIRRPGIASIVLGCILALTLAAAITPRPAEAMPRDHDALPFDSVRIRYEGYLKAIGAGKWLIGDLFVLVDGQTRLIEKRGRAEVGAWVVVWGIRDDNSSVYGEIIQVERPAGRSGPTIEFSGMVTKQIQSGDTHGWIIGDMLVVVTASTQIIGEPGLGWLVWVVAEQRVTELRALVIEAITDSPATMPVEFRGIIEAYSPDGGQIDGHRFILDRNALISGQPAVGRVAEVRATQLEDGILLVHLLRIVGLPGATATGSSQPLAAQPVAANAHQPEVVASHNAGVAPWTAPMLVANDMSNASGVVLARTAAGDTHALWQTSSEIMHAVRAHNGSWSTPQRVMSGREPAIAVDSNDQLHVIFTNQMFNKREQIYHSRYVAGKWSPATEISRTSGASEHPALAVDKEGFLHATWTDDTPGYPVIYIAKWSKSFWSNQPIPNARGLAPAIAVTNDGAIFVAWEDRVPTLDNPTGYYDIVLCERRNGGWALPINISDRADQDAKGVSLATTNDGMAHLVWIERGRTVRYNFGQGFYWPEPQTVAQAAFLARGPRIAVDTRQALYIAWDEGNIVRATASASKAPPAWPKPEIVAWSSVGTLKDVGLTIATGGRMTLSWVQISQPEGSAIYTSHHEQWLPRRIWLPTITGP